VFTVFIDIDIHEIKILA